MKRLFIFIGFVFALGCSLPTASAQNTSTQGKEFWLTFMHNGFREHPEGGWVTTQVLISAKRDCNGTVANPLTGWSQDFTVRANNITTVEIPEAQGYHDQYNYEAISQKGIKVQADDTISVYCTNIAHVSFDASFVLPIESLGDEYIIQSFDQSITPFSNPYAYNNETSVFVIVATEDNTVIDITPKCNTLGGRTAGETFSITMNEAVVDIVYPGHYVLLQQREVIVFLLYDRLFFLLEMTSPLIDVAVFECRIAGIDAKLYQTVPGLDRRVGRLPLHPSELGFDK